MSLFTPKGGTMIMSWVPNCIPCGHACDLGKTLRAHRARWAPFLEFGAQGPLRPKSPIFLWAALLSHLPPTQVCRSLQCVLNVWAVSI